MASDTVRQLSNGAVSGLFDTVDGLVNFFLALILAYWFAKDYPVIVRELAVVAGPSRKDDMTLLLAVMSRSMGGYMRGQLICSFINGIAVWLGLALLGHPYAGLIAIITFFMHFVPVIGPFVSAALATLLALFESPWHALWSLVVMVVAANVTDNVISPLIMRSAVKIHPVLSIVGIVIGNCLGGIVGMVLAIPLTAAIRGVFVYYFETRTKRQLVSEDGALFQSTPHQDAQGNVEAVYDALDDEKNMRIALTGAELTGENREALLHSLCPDPRHVNLVMLHGALAEYDAKDREEGIPLSRLRGRGIDYLALGHYHEYREGRIDPRGKYCYAGCLEGRGFDECGPRGFVVVDIDDETYHVTTEFVPFAARLVLEVPVDVSGLDTTAAMCARVREALLSEASPEHLVKVVLTGEVPVECEKDPEFIAAQFAGDYYWLRVQDDTRLFVDYRDFRLDASLKGEFVRTVESDETLSEERKAEIIRCGIRALMGESEQGC